MARLILISIPDNVEADKLVEAIRKENVLIAYPATERDSESLFEEVKWKDLEDAKVEAVWAKPTKFCTCPDYTGVSAPTKNFRWMVHAKCGMPRPGALQHPRDLTRPDAPAKEIPYYLGFRADSQGWVIPREKK